MIIGNQVYSQDWKTLSETDAKEFLERVQEANPREGCYDLKYTSYNFSLESTPTSQTSGKQCLSEDAMVSQTDNSVIDFVNDEFSLRVNSERKILELGYNAAIADLKDRWPEAVDKLIKIRGGIKLRNLESGEVEMRMLSIESNGISRYRFVFDSDIALKTMIIFYEEQIQKQYGREDVINAPILQVDFKKVEDQEFSEMLYAKYFIKEDSGRIEPSDKFSEYRIEDNRIKYQE
jgi:hypothetical protein